MRLRASCAAAAASPYAHLKVKELRRLLAAAVRARLRASVASHCRQGVEYKSILEKSELEATWASLDEARRRAAEASVAPPAQPPAPPPPASDAPFAPPPAAADDSVALLCVDLAKFLCKRGLRSGCMMGSVLLLEELRARGIDAALTQGYLLCGAPPAFHVWHVWVTHGGRVYDTGSEILRARRGEDAASLNAALSLQNVSFSLKPVPGLLRLDAETEFERMQLAANEQGWAATRVEDLEESYWRAAPPEVKALRAEVKKEFAGRALKLGKPRAAGFGRPR